MRDADCLELPRQPALNVDVLALVADSIICTGEDGRILVFNQAAEDAFGYDANEVIGQPVEILLPRSDRAEHVRQVRNFALGDGAANRLMGRRREVRGRRKNGDEFPAEAMVSRQTVDGKTILTVVLRDITERKALEELREAAACELDHRLRNVLSVVNSLVSLSAQSARNVEEFQESLTGRLAALAKTQSALRGKQQRASLRELFLAELAQYETPEGANLAVTVPPVPVGPKAAQILALAVHELATNAAKYGALSTPGGRVSVTSDLKGEGDEKLLVIQWSEAGGPPVKPPEREGFGTRLITQVVAKSLHADVAMDYRPQGLIFQLTVPTAVLEADR
ncbi:MAG: PAS domain S-box protein [Allosphingosinicella sp.]